MKKVNKMVHNGDLIVTVDNQNSFKNLTEVSGSIYVYQGATLTAPALTKSGYIYVQKGATLTAPALTEVSGSIDVQKGATLTAPALTEISGSIYVRQGATLTAPALTKSGYIDVYQGATLTAPALTEVSGYIYVYQGATLTAPALTKSGSIYVRQGATLTAPALTKSGYIDVRQGATLTIPQTKDLEYRSVDNTLFVVEAEKTSKGIKIYTGYVITKISEGRAVKRNCFVAEKEGFTAHGETVRTAIGDLQFKIVAEKLKNEPIDEDTLITVKHYRLITGACNLGVRAWMESNNIPYKIVGDDETVAVNPIKASELWPLLEKTGAWGVDRFESLKSF